MKYGRGCNDYENCFVMLINGYKTFMCSRAHFFWDLNCSGQGQICMVLAILLDQIVILDIHR